MPPAISPSAKPDASAPRHVGLAELLGGSSGPQALPGQPWLGLSGAWSGGTRISGSRTKDAEQAELYTREIAPLWTQPFAQLLLSQTPALGKSTLLDVRCRAGEAGLPLLRRSPQARLVAIEASPVMLELARQEAGSQIGRRVFLRRDSGLPRLPFDSEVFDLVQSNLGLLDTADPRGFLRELLRVAKPGASVLITLPLRDSFAEFHELLLRTIGQTPRAAALLETARTSLPDALTLYSWALEAGLEDVAIVTQPFSLLFGGGPDFFFSPLIAQGPLSAWLPAFGETDDERQAVFSELCAAIDRAALGDSASSARPSFGVTVRAACLRARRPLPPPPLSFDEDPENAPTRPGHY